MAGLVVIMRPYKKIDHNVIDFLILFLLTVIGAPSSMEMIAGIFYMSGLIYFPFIPIFCYVFYCLIVKGLLLCFCGSAKRQCSPGNKR